MILNYHKYRCKFSNNSVIIRNFANIFCENRLHLGKKRAFCTRFALFLPSDLSDFRCYDEVFINIFDYLDTKTDMNKVRITAIRQTVYEDLMAKYENPIEHTCDVREGQQWISIDGQQPEGMCPSAWYSMREFVESLARGEGNFYDGWMKNPMSAMISCNDGFRPFSFYIEVIE